LLDNENLSKQEESFSNWGKKILEEERMNQNTERHVVKVSGVEFEILPGIESTSPQVEQNTVSPQREQNTVSPSNSQMDSNVTSNFPVSVGSVPPKKKTIKESVEEFSEGTYISSHLASDKIAVSTMQFSDQMLIDTLPTYENLSGIIQNTLNQICQNESPELNIPEANLHDNLRDQVNFKMNQIFNQTESNMNNYFIGTNNDTEKYFNNAAEKCNNYAEEAIKIVNDKTAQIINVIANTKLNENTNLNIMEIDNDVDMIMLDVEKKSGQLIV